MRKEIHPEYKLVTATCSCGNVIKVGSTLGKEELTLDICSACHPFYTGTQRVVDTGGRIDKFKKRFGALSSK
ncbi:50S ribosomal protein L31 [Vibrio sp. 1-Bac 57]|jgi:large subunit ribosomal protein L31|uniref:Large ribosomal subunit protein bL31 n=1 Tax=Psychromonas arctica TaxID=168275 RepID=A0ABU9HBU6_9GAMM|nr:MULTISPECIES: 50S ribosomal protein L31 [unclassified Psychromonas]